MQALEFQAICQNGMIKLPSNQSAWDGKKIKVILLEQPTERAVTESDDLSIFRTYRGRYQGGFDREECYDR